MFNAYTVEMKLELCIFLVERNSMKSRVVDALNAGVRFV